jgi:hypothetical protein
MAEITALITIMGEYGIPENLLELEVEIRYTPSFFELCDLTLGGHVNLARTSLKNARLDEALSSWTDKATKGHRNVEVTVRISWKVITGLKWDMTGTVKDALDQHLKSMFPLLYGTDTSIPEQS